MPEKEIVRTERAPAPFQGAPYNQAVKAAGLVFMAGQVGLQPGGEIAGRRDRRADRAGDAEPARDPRGGRERSRQARQDDRVPPELRRLRRDERGVREPRRRQPAGALDRRGREAPLRRARRDRGGRAPLRHNGAVWNSVADYVHSLGLDAYVVGGAVRDELLGIPVAGARLRRPRSRPRRAARRARAARPRRGPDRRRPAGGRAPAAARQGGAGACSRRGSSSRRRASSARPGLAATTSRSSPTRGSRSSRTWSAATSPINAIARRLETGEVLDPLGGRADLERGVLRTTSPTSFRDDPLRIVRGLRFVSQLGFDPDEDTLRQMREWAPQLEHVSGERIGGGLAADGLGELSKLLLGAAPGEGAQARPRHRRAPAPAAGVRARDRLSPAERSPASDARRAHVRRRAGGRRRGRAAAGAAGGAPARPRQARSASGREATTPRSAPPNRADRALSAPPLSHEAAGLRRQARPRAPVRSCRASRRRSTRAASSRATASGSRSTCSPTGRPTWRGKTVPDERVGAGSDRFRALVEQERGQPHRLADLDGRRRRPDRGRLLRGPGARPRAADAARRGRRGSRAETPRATS